MGENKEIKSLGINIGASKTVYSIFSKINDKYVSNVLLMNNSSRTIPSIICYTKTHRLFGDNSLSSLKQNLNTSYNNLSRIYSYNKNISLYKNEYLYALKKFGKDEEYKFNFVNYKNEEKQLTTNKILADFLYLINDYYFNKEKVEYDISTISLPDFYPTSLKQNLKIICKGVNLKNINFCSESSAITMYYGYTKFRDNFVVEKNNIQKDVVKNILFIDMGHSQTSFILSSFKYNEFRVKYVNNCNSLGGRNLDYYLGNYCLKKFKEKNKIEIEKVTDKMRYRLIEAIKAARIKLTVNTEIEVIVDAFYNETDLKVLISREEIRNMPNFLEYYEKFLDQVIKYSEDNNIKIDCVEIAGQLMYTPILQEIIEKKNLKIGKSLLIDECTSVGAALLGSFIYQKESFPLRYLENFYIFNYHKINYQINYDYYTLKGIFLPRNTLDIQDIKINFKKEYITKGSDVEVILNYPDDEFEKQSKKKCYLKFYVDLDLIYEDERYKKLLKNDNVILKFKYNKEKMSLSGGKLMIGSTEVDKKYFSTQINKQLYNLGEKQIKKMLDSLKEYFDERNEEDKKYHDFIEKKMKVSEKFYALKNLINKKKFEDKGKIKEFEKKLKKKDLTENDLNEIESEIETLDKEIPKEESNKEEED